MTAVARRSWRRSGVDRRTVLFAYTALEIVIGSVALAWAILAMPVAPAISLTGAARPFALIGGVAFWSGFTLLGGTRVGSIHGFGVLTFHMPFILAAAALGGPAAGGVVAFLGSLELRELRDPPWYGLLANHAAFALAGVVAGLAMTFAASWFMPLGLASEPATVLAFLVGAGGFIVVSLSLAAGTSMIRDSAEAIDAYMGAYRATMLTEVVVGLMLALLYGRIGVWAAIVGGIVVLQLVRLLGEREYLRRNGQNPGLLKYEELRQQTLAAARYWPIGYLVVTIEGWGAFVAERGREAADQLALSVGRMVAETLFRRDFAAESGEGEWRILLVTTDVNGAIKAALKYRDAIAQVLTEAGCVDGRWRLDGPALRPTIGGGMADDVEHGARLAESRAEQAAWRALRERVSIVIRTATDWIDLAPAGGDEAA